VHCTISLDNLLCSAHIALARRATPRKRNQKAAPRRRKRVATIQTDTIQKFSKDNADAALKSFGVVSKGAQAIAVETADYAKKSFEQSTATLEKLVGAKTLDKAIEIQTDFVKSAYEGFVAQSTKLGELYASLAKEAFKPYEGLVAVANGKAAK
jgi:phasin family protein